jgi:hypothetical protein
MAHSNAKGPNAESSGSRLESESKGLASRRIAILVTTLLSVALVFLLLFFRGGRGESTAIRELAAMERRALYERTLQTLLTSCEPEKRPSGLDAFCDKQAVFILQFPECHADCQALANSRRTPPAR